MEIIRKITNSSVFEGIIDLPESMKDKEILVTIRTCEDNRKNISFRKLRGSLSKYQNRSLIEKEKDAWANSVVDDFIPY